MSELVIDPYAHQYVRVDDYAYGFGKVMRHVKLGPGTATNAAALSRLINAAYSDMKARVENG